MTTRVVEKSNYRMHTSFNSNQDDERKASIGIDRPFRNDSPSKYNGKINNFHTWIYFIFTIFNLNYL